MAFTRFNDDPCRIFKYLEETTNIGNYHINVPGNGLNPQYITDPHIRIQKWGANISDNMTDIESDLRRITRHLNRDNKELNEYTKYINDNKIYNLNSNNFPINNMEITQQSRTILPAWTVREIDNINYPNNFKYLHYDPQKNIYNPLINNISSRIIEKDEYILNYN
jgi:hypothetical protein